MKILSLILLLAATSANANYCKDLLLADQIDSNHMTVYAGEISSNESEMMDKQMALNSANYMNQIYDCNQKLNFQNSQIKCSDELMKHHKICNVQTKYGYYIVYKDYVDTVHITFSRWD